MAVITLDKLVPGESARIKKIGGRGPIRRRLVDMGLTSGALIEMIKVSPLGDPVEYRVRGYHLTLRMSEAKTIQVELIGESIPLREAEPVSGLTLPLVRCESGQTVVVIQTRGGKKLRGRFRDLGLEPGVNLRVIRNDFPGPLILALDDESRLALGKGMARHIFVKPS
ncbi:MAG: ferrous iron transport protein A [Anaerolineales bacterium]